MGEMDEIVREFLVESYENLDQLEQDMVSLESDPGSRDLLSSIFRTIHTIKGTAGFLAYGLLEKVAHRGENLLSELRDGVRDMNQPTADVLLMMVDRIRMILTNIEDAGAEGEVDIDEIIAKIEVIQSGGIPEVEAKADAAPAPAPIEVKPVAGFVSNIPDESAATPASETVDASESLQSVGEAIEVKPVAGFVSNIEPETPAVAPSPTPVVAEEVKAAPTQTSQTMEETPKATASRASAADSSIRVSVDLLDMLMSEVSELVLVRNQISRLTGSANADMDLTQAAQRLSLVATELQEGIMKTRMQPIEHLWNKMPRIVRDLANQLGKEVNLTMIGGDTELDRSLLEAIKDPLTHLVRNAVDHGVETPDIRQASGKDPKGSVTLKAYHAGGQVIVDIEDDGAGIDALKVAQKALNSGVVTQAQLDEMSDKEIYNLLFLPGFSTAQKITNISGRGVGTDVVKTSVEAIGGTVDVDAEVGKGSTWRMRIPLTLAIQPSLTIESANEVYAIPQVSLMELVALDNSGKENSIEYVNSSPVYRLRGQLLPLVYLSHVLHPEKGTAEDRVEGHNGVIAVLQADQQRFGLVVDKVINNEEIVVKPLSSKLKGVGVYSGATLLGDGRVALILDVGTIARRELTGASAEASRRAQVAAEAAMAADEVSGQVLVVGIGEGRRVAIPLAAVTRLERMDAAKVERVGGREVLQYRDSILPIVRLERLLGASNYDEPDDLQIVVYRRGERQVAMVVREILDIVADDKRKHSTIEDHGLIGSAVLKDRVTELLDVEQAVRAADPTFFDDVTDFQEEMDANSRLDMVGV